MRNLFKNPVEFIKRHKWLISALGALIIISSLVSVQIAPIAKAPNHAITVAQVGKYVITVGSGVDASVTADYTATGTAAQITNTFQIALNALPATGGILEVLSGTYTLNATLTRAIPNVTVQGIGSSTIFSDNGSTPIFTAGRNGWCFQNLVVDLGSINMGSTIGWSWSNVTVGSTLYTDESINGGTGRTASYVIAASDAPASVKAQADVTLTADNTLHTAIASALASGYTSVHLSQGTFVDNSITLSSTIDLSGSGSGFHDTVSTGVTVIIGTPSDSHDIISVNAAANSHVYIHDLKIYGNSPNGNTGKVINKSGACYFEADNIVVTKAGNTGILSYNSGVILRNIEMTGIASGNGIELHFADNWLQNVLVQGSVSNFGIALIDSPTTHMDAITTAWNGLAGIYVNNCYGSIFSNIITYDNNYQGMRLGDNSGSNAHYILDNILTYLNGQGVGNPPWNSDRVGLVLSGVTNSSITNVVSYGVSQAYCLDIYNSSNNYIHGGSFADAYVSNVNYEGTTGNDCGGFIGWNPVGKISNPIGTSTIGLDGTGTTVTSATVYTVTGVSCFITSTGGTVSNIVIKDTAGNTMLTGVTTLTNQFLPIGYSVTWTHTGAPTVTVFGN